MLLTRWLDQIRAIPPRCAFPPPGNGPERPFRVGWFTAIGSEAATPEVASSVEHAAMALGSADCEVFPAPAPYDLAMLRRIWSTLTAAGAARVAARFPDRWQADMTDNARAAAERGFKLPVTDYVDALDALAAWRCDVTANWGNYDALVLPTAAAPAWRAEDEAPPGLTAATQGMFGGWVNAAGLSGISVAGEPHPDGRPIGVQIVAPFGHDAIVLEIARRLETISPWSQRWPAMALAAQP